MRAEATTVTHADDARRGRQTRTVGRMEEQQVWARGILVLGSLIMVAAVVFVVVGLMLRDRGLGWLLFAGPGVALVGVVMLVLSAGLRRSAARVALDDDED